MYSVMEKMFLNLTDLSDEPLQGQIIRQVRAKILAGEIDAREPLPSIRGLAKENKVSVITVQRAYESLMNEGLIHSRRGKGFFVSPLGDGAKRKLALERFTEALKPAVEAALAEGLNCSDIRPAIEACLAERE